MKFIAVLHTDIVTTIGVVFDGEGRRLTLAQHVQLLSQNLDIARFHLGVLSLALTDDTSHLDTPLTTQLVSLFTQGSILRLVEYQLRDAIAVAQVDKRHTTHLAGFLNPSGQCYLLTSIGESQLTTCLCPIHYLYIIRFRPAKLRIIYVILQTMHNTHKKPRMLGGMQGS